MFQVDRPTFFPSGTALTDVQTKFHVRIRYREPGYARKHNRKAQDYRWTFCVQAVDTEHAKTLAKAEFREIERLSAVGWSREITEIAVVDE